jgi:mannonate dehydratase
MKVTFRWYGDGDPVRLSDIRQIPAVAGVVTAVYDVPVGEVWTRERIRRLKGDVSAAGLAVSVVESLPVHEDIKLGRPTRDRYIANYMASLANLGAEQIPVVTYNFMALFDWMRTDLEHRLPDGSTSLAYDGQSFERLSIREAAAVLRRLPGWDPSYSVEEAERLLEEYRELSHAGLAENLAYFLRAVGPAAKDAGVRLAIHPDDPPWDVWGLPRIVTGAEDLARLLSFYDHPSNGLCVCVGSLGASPGNDVVAIMRRFAAEGRVHFAHLRNIVHDGPRQFHESGHRDGDLNLAAVVRVLKDAGYTGPVRPDHGRRIWDEDSHGGYGLYDRALGAMYLAGLYDALTTS